LGGRRRMRERARERERSMVLSLITKMVLNFNPRTPVLKNRMIVILAGKKIGGMW
jgi:hypothetical protein